MKEITFQVQTITPEIAVEWIKLNKYNRPISSSVINKYATVMRRGGWKLNGDSFRFDEDGYILDGQHRLYAILESGISIESLVVRGLSREVFTTIDRGNMRKLSDFIALEGYKNSVLMAAAMKWVYAWKNDFKIITGRVGIDVQDVMSALKEEEGLDESVKLIAKIQSRQKVLKPSAAAAFHYIFSKKEPYLAQNFFEQLYTGANLPVDSPILALRNQQINQRMGNINQSSKHLTISIIKCWNYYVKNESLAMLKVGAIEEIPEIATCPKELKLSA